MILVTGSAGFIGANFVLDWCAQHDEAVISLDKLTYAGNLENLDSLKNNPRHVFSSGRYRRCCISGRTAGKVSAPRGG